MDFIIQLCRRSDCSHVSVDTVHPSRLRYSYFTSHRWYHFQSISSDVVLVLSVMTWPISSIFNACMHHRRRSLKSVLHTHHMSIFPPHCHHLHIEHIIYRAPMYPGAGDLHTRWSRTGYWLDLIRFQVLDVDMWPADRHQPTPSPRMQTDINVGAALLHTAASCLHRHPCADRVFFTMALGRNTFSNAVKLNPFRELLSAAFAPNRVAPKSQFAQGPH